MSNKSKHSITPWVQDNYDVYSDSDEASILVAECEDQANAARIVQCVNEYDGLIEQIESIRAENLELIEGFRSIVDANKSKDLVPPVYLMTGIAVQKLSKYEK